MSSPPIPYTRYFDFTTFATLNPDKPLPGGSVDVEYNRLKVTTDQLIARLGEIQRSDGKLQDGAITTSSLLDGSVTTPKLADLAVTTPKLADGAVTGPKIAPGSVNGAAMAPGSITSLQIQDGGVATVDLADGAVTTPKLADGAVTTAKIAPGAVIPSAIPDGSITSAKLADGTVATIDLANNSVTTPKLGPAAVDATKLAPGAVGNAAMAPNAIATANMQDAAVTTPKLADAAVTLAKMAPGSVDSSKIVDGSIDISDLSDVTKSYFSGAGVPRGVWQTNTDYVAKDLVTYPDAAGSTYICQIAHHSANFPGDYASAKWMIYSRSMADAIAIAAPLIPGANLIMNGDFRVNQRYGTVSVTLPSGAKIADRWGLSITAGNKVSSQTLLTNLNAPLPSYLYLASLGVNAPAAPDTYILYHKIELPNFADLQFGGPNAMPVTLSFWAYASVTATYGGALRNDDQTSAFRSYPFSFILPATTWTKVVVTIPGDTAGSWLAPNNNAMQLSINLGCGSALLGPPNVWSAANYHAPNLSFNMLGVNGANLYLTGIKLERGSVATPFVPDDYQVLLAKCQRYFQKYGFAITSQSQAIGSLMAYSGGGAFGKVRDFLVQMRAVPTITISALADFGLWPPTGAAPNALVTSLTPRATSHEWGIGSCTIALGNVWTPGMIAPLTNMNLNAYYTLDAEL